MAKRYTKEQWEEVKQLFKAWCVLQGEFNMRGFLADHKHKKFPFGYDGFRLQALKWQEEIEGAIVRSGIPGAEEEFQRIQRVNETEKKALITTAAQTINDRIPQIEIVSGVINDCIQDGLVGYANSTKVFATLSEITRGQLERLSERLNKPVTVDPNDPQSGLIEEVARMVSMEEAGAVKMLIDSLDKAHKLFKGTAIIPKERLKEIQPLEDVAKLEYIREAEKAKSNAKETDESKAQQGMQERLKEYAKDKYGVEV